MATTDSIEARTALAVDAACEIEALVIDILERIANNPSAAELSLRGACMRIRELSRVSMTVLTEPDCDVERLDARVSGIALLGNCGD